MFEWVFSPDAWATLITLSALEIVLGVDNIIFLAILVSKLPPEHRDKGRILGLGFAMVTRILLLLSLFWVMKLITPLFSLYVGDVGNLSEEAKNAAFFSLNFFAFFSGGIADFEGLKYWGEISGRDLVLFFGGLFLIIKSIKEIKEEILSEHSDDDKPHIKISSKLWVVVAEIAIIDIVFSLDSVITAVGIADNIEIMIIAVILAVLVMLFASKPIADFVERYPSIKILALAFLIMIGVVLVAESLELHFGKAYIYVAMVFALGTEILNIIATKKKNKRKEK